MPLYRFKAMDVSGKIVTGQLDALHLNDLESRLLKQELDLIVGKETKKRSFSGKANRLSRRDLINFSFYLEQLSNAGVPFVESLIDLRNSLEPGFFREMTTTLIEDVEAGKTFSEAISEFPRVFSPTFVSLIQAGEVSGEMSQVLNDLHESLKWQDEMISQTKRALTYPLFVGIVLIGVIFFLMIYLVPQLVSFVTTMGEELPVYTKVLIAVSGFFVDYWYLIVAIPAVSISVFAYLLKRSKRMQYQFDNIKLKIMIIGPILKKILLARFLNNFGLMFNAGIPVLEALKTTEKIANNRVIEKTLQQCRVDISEGKSIVNAFSTTDIFPPLVLRMIRVGESTGDLGTSLKSVNYFFQRDITESIARLQTLIEPVMTVVLGLILGWVMISVLGPIYDLISNIKV